jgi:hypothetical protein
MNGRQELLAYLGSSIATVVALFGLQYWYATYLDVSVVHAQHDDAPLSEKVAAVRAEEEKKLASGSLPIEQAKQALAQRGRVSFARIAPKASDDVSAMGGWIYQPGFKPYESRAPKAPAEDATASAEGTEPAAAAPAQKPEGAP